MTAPHRIARIETRITQMRRKDAKAA